VFEEDIRVIDDSRSVRSTPAPREVSRELEVRKTSRPEPPRVREKTNINIDLDLGRGKVAVKEKEKSKERWTEVTKDLVCREAIDAKGYDYEETDDFFYVMEYLQFVSVIILCESDSH